MVRGTGRESSLPQGEPLVAVTRGRLTESFHLGSIAVVSEDGRLLASAGDPFRPTVLRSSAKPFQLVPFLAAGGERRYRLSTGELALAAASHGGERLHAAAALGLLGKGGFGPDALHCGAHPPMHVPSARELLRRGVPPSALHNNCSGKHAAMLLACRLLGYDPATYWKPEHPLQRRILAYLALVAGLPAGRIGVAVDGCSVPVFQLPLYHLALAYARLFAERVPGETAPERSARRRVAAAMTAAPEMVAGQGRFTTGVMRAFGGGLVAKEGADAVYAMSASPRIASGLGRGAVGVALKIDDGSERGRDVVSVEALRQLGLARGRVPLLRRLAPRRVRNVRGDVVGTLQPLFALRLFAAAAPAGSRRPGEGGA